MFRLGLGTSGFRCVSGFLTAKEIPDPEFSTSIRSWANFFRSPPTFWFNFSKNFSFLSFLDRLDLKMLLFGQMTDWQKSYLTALRVSVNGDQCSWRWFLSTHTVIIEESCCPNWHSQGKFLSLSLWACWHWLLLDWQVLSFSATLYTWWKMYRNF